MLSTFSVKPGDVIKIVWDPKNTFNDGNWEMRKYYYEVNGKRIGLVPTTKSKFNKAEDRKAAILLRETLQKEYESNIASKKQWVSELTFSFKGYSVEYADTKNDQGAVIGNPISSTKINKLVRKGDKGARTKQLQKSGGFILGAVKADDPTNPTLVQFSSVDQAALDLNTHDKATSKYIEKRFKQSNNEYAKALKDAEDSGATEFTVWYYRPYDKEGLTDEQLKSQYGESRTYEVADATYAEQWLADKYAEDTKGHVWIGIPNPALDNEVLLTRAFYIPNRDLQEDIKKEIYDYIQELIKSGMSGAKLFNNLKDTFVLSNGDKGLLNAILKDVQDVTTIPWGNKESTSVKTFWMVMGSSHITIDMDNFNKPADGTSGNRFVKNDTVPFNVAAQSFLKVTINQDQPLTNVQPIIYLEPNKVIPQEVVNKPLPIVSNAEPLPQGLTQEESKAKKEVIKEAVETPPVGSTPTSPEVAQSKPISSVASKAASRVGSRFGKNKPTDDVKLRQSTETVTDGTPEELEWFKQYFPHIPVKDLEEIKDYVRNLTKQGATAWGAFTNAAIYLRDAYPAGTVYHEAFHVVFNLALSDRDKATLLNQAEGNTPIEKEEWLAEKFREILLSPTDRTFDPKVKGFISKVFRKLKLFIKSVFNAPVNNLYELVYRVEKGKYSKTRPTRFTEDFCKIVS